jgi:putative hydrolase of the HAD superfamily
MPKIKALVFDLDGTLVDQEGAERDALQQLLDHEIKLEAKPAFHVFLRDWRNIADEYLQRFLDNQMGFDEQRIKRFEALFAKYGEPITRLEAERLHQAYGRLYAEQWRAFDETAEVLLNLKQAGYRLAVITNGDGAAQRGKLKATNLEHWFENILVSGDVKVRKPDTAIFRLSEKALGLKPEELAYVGDRPEADVAGALAAGWLPIWLDRKGMPDAQSTLGPKVLVVQRLTQVQAKLS